MNRNSDKMIFCHLSRSLSMDSRDEFPQLPRGASHHYKIFCGFQKSISSAVGYDCNALPARSHQFQFGFCSPAASVGAFTWEGVGGLQIG